MAINKEFEMVEIGLISKRKKNVKSEHGNGNDHIVNNYCRLKVHLAYRFTFI